MHTCTKYVEYISIHMYCITNIIHSKNMQYDFGKQNWGEPIKPTYTLNTRDVLYYQATTMKEILLEIQEALKSKWKNKYISDWGKIKNEN